MRIDSFPADFPADHSLQEDNSWQEQALCAQVGADFFFPEPGSSVREAKRICQLCQMRSACLEYALVHDERFGVWGGLSEKERRDLRRQTAPADHAADRLAG